MRRRWMTALAACATVAALAVPVPALAAGTCNGLPVTITGTSGNDTIVGTAGNDVIAAGAGNDVIFGLEGDDTVCGGTGDDRFDSGPGRDTFVAEARPDGRDTIVARTDSFEDTVTYAARTTAVTLSPDGVANDGTPGEGDNISDVNAVIGGSGNDTLTDSPVGQHALSGGPGNDKITGHFSLFGGPGDDTLTIPAGSGSALAKGNDGNDRITNGGLRSNLTGDNGDDTIIGGNGGDVIFGGNGDDVLIGGTGADSIFGEAGNDQIAGGLGDDDISGGDGDDIFIATIKRDGADGFFGGAGVDTADYSARNNLATGTILSLSLDGVFGNDGEPGEGDTLGGDVENVKGGVGRNFIVGNALANNLRGGQSADFIVGADGIGGNDVIDGVLTGNICSFDPGDTVTNC
ncbi:Hemolysin-type calcium-binding repeat-containing protein [Amycolatopsis xylanica]|uniref:Hemolysin-type calcium-binding repeat-containing protein n=1 Tax=Amycolatopsis xylanica TaxID=589385 RepID=A0A1H3E1H0_9PSEU|nr:calcium-binding protein [Amycolatopsis xylanica]SDX72128.1 Hemolysin-type calcium-binding repeat-containing protein [Amycolatopsis xylanica]